MRTILWCFLAILTCIGINNTSSNAWTDKREVEALITEKWEDWSGEARNPYKVLFAVEVTNNRSVTGPVITTYYEKGYVDAREYLKIVTGETKRVYKTSYKDLGVEPTYAQKQRDEWNSVFLFILFIVMPILAVFFWAHWVDSSY